MRKLKGFPGIFVYIVLLCMGLFHLYTGIYGTKEAYLQRMIHLTFVLPMVFLLFPSTKKDKDYIPFYDWIFAFLSFLPGIYAILTYDEISNRIVQVDPVTNVQLVFGLILIATLIEAARRTVGLPLAIIALFFTGYMNFGRFFPGILHGEPFGIREIVEELYLTGEGIFGIPLGVSASFVIIFLILGGFLEESGLGDYFMKLAILLAGRYRGGPAKIAVLSSGLFGMLSGSAVANVYGTGNFTIPMMIKIGYKPEFAAAVEAVASAGGQIMPPIMGASAFIIASFLGIPYQKVMLAALVPAVLYYFAIFIMVHYEAVKSDLKGIAKEVLPDKKKVLSKIYMLIPVVVLIVIMSLGYTPMFAAIVGIFVTILTSLLSKETRMKPKQYIDAIVKGSRNVILVAVACATAGIVIGSITLTGFGFKFVGAITSLASGMPFFALILTMIISIILGMGLPTTGAYILASALGVPALIKLGFAPLASHLFVFYFAIVSAITPPVALAAFAGASIAKSDPNRTGLIASRLGIIAYILPFAIMYDHGLILEKFDVYTLISIVAAFLAATFLALSLSGYIKRELAFWEKSILALVGLLLLIPDYKFKLAGIVIAGIGYILSRR